MNRLEIIVYRHNRYDEMYISHDGGITCYDAEEPMDSWGGWLKENVKDMDIHEVWRSGSES